MKTRSPFLNPSCWCALILLAVDVGFGQSGQNPLNDLSKSQNTSQDLLNSLVAAPEKAGKGEKKEQINAAQLKSKSINDSTFGGSLLNSGITGSQPKLDERKVHAAPAEKESNVSKQPVTTGNQGRTSKQSDASEPEPAFSNLTQTATLAQELGESEPDTTAASEKVSKAASSSGSDSKTTATGSPDPQKKGQTAARPSTTSDEKVSKNATEKASETKPDGDH